LTTKAEVVSRYNELVLGWAAVVWGVLLMLPGDLFAAIPRYTAVDRFAPDFLWGLVLTVAGAACIFAPEGGRGIAHGVLFVIWLGINALVLIGTMSVSTVLIATFPFTMCLLHAGEYVRLSRR